MYTEKDLREAFRAGQAYELLSESDADVDVYITAAKEKQTENLNKLSEMYNNNKE